MSQAAVDLESVHEEPVFAFQDFGVAFHYLYRQETLPALSELNSDVAFHSLERDLLSYAYRESKIFASQVVRQSDEPLVIPVVLHLPLDLKYQAEGTSKKLLVRPDDRSDGKWRRRALLLKVSRTIFRTGHVVIHLVLSPDPNMAEQALLNEYDIIKLAKHWEGGESVGPGEEFDIRKQLHFTRGNDSRPLSIEDLANEAARTFHPVKLTANDLRTGTIQINTESAQSAKDWAELWDTIKNELQRKAPGEEVDEGPERVPLFEPEIKAVGGILQGLLDFLFIKGPELLDVFTPINSDDELMGIHKGTLLYMTDSCRIFNLPIVKQAIGVSPYLIIPHTLLLYNDAQLQEAANATNKLPSTAEEERDLPRAERVEQEIELIMREGLQRNWLPNLFHYHTERWLFERGLTSRGLTGQRENLLEQLKNLDGRLDEIRATIERNFQRAIGRGGILLALIGVPLTIFQALGNWNQVMELWNNSHYEAFAITMLVLALITGGWYLPTWLASRDKE